MPTVMGQFLNSKFQRPAVVDHFLVFGLLKEHRDRAAAFYGDLLQHGGYKVIWMLVRKPDMGNVAKVCQRELGGREQIPAMMKGAAKEPRIGDQMSASIAEDK